VQFLSHGSGYTVFLTSTGAVLSLPQAAPNPGPGASAGPGTVPPASAVLSMQLVGANAQAQGMGLAQQAGTSNYLIGNDPTQWHSNIPNYAQVEYQNLYPGINLIYYGNQRQLEYDFQLAPGANPGAIQLAFQGAQNMSLDSQGNLVLHTAGGDVV